MDDGRLMIAFGDQEPGQLIAPRAVAGFKLNRSLKLGDTFRTLAQLRESIGYLRVIRRDMGGSLERLACPLLTAVFQR
jgi:hypothetical protein